MRTFTGPVAALVGALVSLPALPATAAAPEVTLGFDLPRGAAVAGAHLEGHTVVDGAVRIPVTAQSLRLVGTSGSSYVVEVDGRSVVRLSADGSSTRLGRTFGSPTRLADTGDRLVTSRIRRDASSVLTVRSAVTGQKLAQRRFSGVLTALDVATDRVLFGGARRTGLWTIGTDEVDVVDGHGGYEGDLTADRVAVLAEPGVEGGCTDVLRVSTGSRVWSSCQASVLAFGPGGQMATTAAYLDGPIGLVELRTGDGTRLATYRSNRGVALDGVRWESPDAVLVGVYGPHRVGTARCSAADCELAGRPVRTNPAG